MRRRPTHSQASPRRSPTVGHCGASPTVPPGRCLLGLTDGRPAAGGGRGGQSRWPSSEPVFAAIRGVTLLPRSARPRSGTHEDSDETDAFDRRGRVGRFGRNDSTPPALAQPAKAPPVIAIKAARLFDGKADALQANGVVLVQGPKILAVGTDLSIPAGAEVIDLGDATLSPGFIDAHTHLTGESTDDWKQQFVDNFRREVAEKAIESTVHARKVLEAGFTTVRDVGSGDLLDVGLRNAIARGLVPGPRMLVAVHALGARGGHADETGLRHDLIKELGPAEGIAHGPDGFREAVRFQVKYGADVIKFSASGGVLSLADEVDTPQLSPEEMKALVDEAHRLRKKVAAHCHGDRAAREAIVAGVDSIEHGSFLTEETLALMKERGTYLVPTLLAGEWVRRQDRQVPAGDRRQGRGPRWRPARRCSAPPCGWA